MGTLKKRPAKNESINFHPAKERNETRAKNRISCFFICYSMNNSQTDHPYSATDNLTHLYNRYLDSSTWIVIIFRFFETALRLQAKPFGADCSGRTRKIWGDGEYRPAGQLTNAGLTRKRGIRHFSMTHACRLRGDDVLPPKKSPPQRTRRKIDTLHGAYVRPVERGSALLETPFCSVISVVQMRFLGCASPVTETAGHP
ncbi:MAG: hypothetical protein PHX38_05810 [Sulfuricella sp.]|nr:hypothetical protein [Sulfuricella sp.]